ncbi:MG2 domain protein [Novipirellula galeiformis]|uniref:MG2 domain protein n=1 Tax=Novipirellula galeiformis TaxID=2528004 RepID=A0A5C6CTW1_9BACT|nr:alpha-2-macroglobulin family protein [Novipirellula galeiformis]TWU26179.1 MG2 domain protein [Novipirellula galeiformis]
MSYSISNLQKLGFASILVLLCATWLWAADPTEATWPEVQEAINQGLPKTAIEKLEPIIVKTKAEKQYAAAIKAIGLKISLEGTIQGNRPEEKIARMAAEIEPSPAEMQPVMQAIVAHWYWHYFQQNRWRFLQRTQTAAPASDDITTWDLPRILEVTAAQFDKALENRDVLQKTPIAQYDELIEKGSAPDSYRPTLWDFLVYEALEFYSSAEQAGARSEDAFDLSADSPIFASAEAFLDWNPITEDNDSPKLKAIRLYQQLLAFHRDDKDPSAFIDTDLHRLEFANNHAFGEEKDARYKAALKRFAEQHATHPISARALHQLATVLQSENDFVAAKKVAEQGLAQHPDSVGGARCFNLIQQIESPSASITTERVWNAPWPTIDVRYRNVDKVYFRLVPFDFDEFVNSNRYQPMNLNQNEQNALMTRNVVKRWSADLPKTEDYQEQLESVKVPEDVKPGSYFLFASHREDFQQADNQVSMAEVWVSDLALVLRTKHGEGTLEGFVLDAKTGAPRQDATVKIWANEGNRRVALPTLTTDANGLFKGKVTNGRNLMLLATHRGHRLSSNNGMSVYTANHSRETSQQTHFFTDRALYRPGQTIRYKGICFSVNQNQNDYKTLANQAVVVVFSDVNGKEIERLTHRTNDYGSFNGSVTAPRDRLMGQMSLRVDGTAQGQTQFRVEEYKRPKFQVKLDPPKEAARLGERVIVKGNATAYTGASLDDAKVSWRVVREVRYPVWWSWSQFWRPVWPPMPSQGNQEIAHGTTRSNANGTFDIEFVAKPDLSVPAQSEPTFQFTVYADVTDSSGETRSDQRIVNVGYTALAATMTAEDWQTNAEPVTVSITTKTLDGEGQSAKGTVTIYQLKQPSKVHRAPLSGGGHWPRRGHMGSAMKAGGGATSPADLSDTKHWELGDSVAKENFETDGGGNAKVTFKLEEGAYRAKLETRDRFGKAVTALLPIQVLDPEAKKLAIKIPDLFIQEKNSVEPGQSMRAIWASGYNTARAFVEIEHRGEIIKSYWTQPKTTQVLIEQAVNESMRGGFIVRTTMVRENRAYLNTHRVEVPWSNKELDIQWEHFVSKLAPAAKESWTAIIKGPDAERAAAEMVATLYDASLDAFQPHAWMQRFNVFYQDHSRMNSQFQNSPETLRQIWYGWNREQRNASLSYRHYPNMIIQNLYGYQFHARARGGRQAMMKGGEAFNMAEAPMMDSAMSRGAPEAAMMSKSAVAAAPPVEQQDGVQGADDKGGAKTPDLDLENVSARKNLNETAFFFPHLMAGEDGTVRMEFTMPEALTEWKFLGFAHDQELRSGSITATTVTAKDLMVQPNPPRFVREGDLIEFTVKVSNQSPTEQSGQVRLSFADAKTTDNVDEQLGNENVDQSFTIPAGQSRSFSWKIKVPDNIGFLTYKAVGSTGRLSDGEEGYLPVLSRRVLVTESLPLPIRGQQEKQFEFEKLINSGGSDTLEHQSLTLQVASNPSWYAVMALPYLMEFPHDCSEQVFNRLYANSLAKHIAGSDPKIERIFDQWRGTPALDSPLEKNQDLKSVLLEETPWVRQAESESQARRNVGILFDQNRLQDETNRSLFKLTEMQLEDGSWPWFPGGRGNDYITLYITTGFGRMRHLGVEVDMQPAIRSLTRLDAWVTKQYEELKSDHRKENHLSTTIALYLYGRSFFLKDQPVAAEHREAVDYWVDQAKTHWLKLAFRQSQAHMAVALKRWDELDAAKAIMASIKERSVTDEELGMFWRENELSWWWYRAPIETQAMMIEAFDEVMNDREAVEDCKVWLLKQKQTQDWKTTKATADAIYALLLRGSDLLASDELVRVDLGGTPIEPKDVEAGTGFYEVRFPAAEVKPELGKVTMRKVDEGVAWGSLHWQYLEDISKVTPHDGTPLTLEKKLFVKKNTAKGPTLVAVDGPVAVGDELVVRIVLRTDRDMEYVHMKDYRGSGTEPVNVLSQYKYQDGLGYYESTRDTASHFFIDYLPKGTYVFEYSTRVQLKGEYQTGFANIECMYAPEFNSHSESLPIVVQ